MSDYVVEFKVRNGRIKRAMQEAGYKSVNALCKQNGLSPSAIGDLLNLRMPPLLQSGQWRQAAIDLSAALDLTPEDLFASSQRTLAVRSNTGSRFVTEDQVHRLVAEDAALQWKLLDYGDPAAQDEEFSVADFLERSQVDQKKYLGLTPRQRAVLCMRYDDEMTLEEIGRRLDVSMERVRQIIATAQRRLRHPSNREAFAKFSPIMADLFKKWEAEEAERQAQEAKEAEENKKGQLHKLPEYLRPPPVRPTPTPWIHYPADGRGPRKVFINGALTQFVIYADTRTGFVRRLFQPYRMNRRTGAGRWYKQRGVITVEFM